MGVPAFFRWLS